MRESIISIVGECDQLVISDLVNEVTKADSPNADFSVLVEPANDPYRDLSVSFYSGCGNVDPETARAARAISDKFPNLCIRTTNQVGNPIPF